MQVVFQLPCFIVKKIKEIWRRERMKKLLASIVVLIGIGLIAGCGGGGSSGSSSSATGSCSVGSNCTPSNLSAVPASE